MRAEAVHAKWEIPQIDTVEVTFIEGATESSSRIDYIGSVPSSDGAPAEALLRDIGNSVNVSATPEIEGTLDTDSQVAVHTVLRNNGQVVAEQDETSAWFRPNFVMHVLLVPIMQEGYTDIQLRSMQMNVNTDLDNLRGRLMPTGELEFHWSSVVTRDESNSLDLGEPPRPL